MSFILAWVLVSAPAYNSVPSFSPAFATLADCQRVQQEFSRYSTKSQCIQLNIERKYK